MKRYVLAVVGGCSINEHPVEDNTDAGQEALAKKIAKDNGRAAILSGDVVLFWADVDIHGDLTVGEFDSTDLLDQ